MALEKIQRQYGARREISISLSDIDSGINLELMSFFRLISIVILPTGSFASRFLPTLPYRLGENSPPISSTHSPPIGLGQFPMTPQVLRPQPQMPSHTLNGQSPPSPSPMHLQPPQLTSQTLLTAASATSVPLSPLRIRVSSPTRINADLTGTGTLSAHSLSSGIIRIASAAAAVQQHHHHMQQQQQQHHHHHASYHHHHMNSNGVSTQPPPMLHRPFSPSPQPKDQVPS